MPLFPDETICHSDPENFALDSYFKGIPDLQIKICIQRCSPKNNKNYEVLKDEGLGDYASIMKECHRVKQSDSLKIT